MSSTKYRGEPSQEQDDSFIVSDSDEEEDSSDKGQTMEAHTRIIEDTDSEGGDSRQNDNSEYVNSEEEDINFMNQSHRVSIIENSSESESDSHEEKNKKINKLKRRSIYENPVNLQSPASESTPKNAHLSRKRAKRVVESDSDSEDAPVKAERNPNNILVYDDDDDGEINDETHFEEHKNSENHSSSVNKSKTVDLDQASNSFLKKKSVLKQKNVIDLTINNSIHNDSIRKNDNKKLVKKQSIDIAKKKEQSANDSDILIVSSTSTSESEVDKEVIMLAKKAIGVGNIDPIDAQKKEYLLINIDFTQKQLDKLNKFAASVDINKLPDKGAKVHATIKEHQEKLSSLQANLTKLSLKIMSNTPQKFQIPKVVSKGIENIKKGDSLISSDEDKENLDTKKDFEKKSVKKESPKNNANYANQFDEFDIKDIPVVPQTTFDAADLGKKALATLNKQQSLTHQKLEQLHGSLTSRPTEDQKEKDPYGLKVPLMPHQQHALAWMKWREKQKPKGGILADDMGLGKTLTMISLTLATINDDRQNDSEDSSSSDDEWLSRNKHKRYYGGTLVICPASLIKQWEAEVKNRCKRGLLTVLVYHGNNRSMEDRKLSKYNIVITTYQIMVREADGQTGMYRMEWNRLILDEAHYIRNHKSKACLAVCGLNAKYKWALTGTPIQNKEMDLYAILKFLKCSPFDDLLVWKRWVDNKNDAGKQRLVTIMKTLMLRRTKQELQSKGSLDSLPDKSLEVIEIEMDREENLAYQKILLFSQNLFAQFLTQRAEKQHMRELYGGKFDRPSYSSLGAKTQFTKAQKVLLEHHSSIEAHEILVLLLRLRQMCCHPALIHAMLDKQDAEVNGLDEEEDVNADLLNKLHNMSIHEDEEVEEYVANYKIDERVAKNLLTKKNPLFNDDRRSSKVREIIKTVEEILEKGDKLIIVSQWTSFLKVIAKNLDGIEDVKYAMFTGEVAVKNRQGIVEKLNDPDHDINVLLLSLTAGGVGLNLVGANHLLLVDIHWNPQLEAQAQDRIYRFGQHKNVYVYKFLCKDTIEERIKNLQDKKLDIANHVLTGSRSVSSKLTIEDLKLLFS